MTVGEDDRHQIERLRNALQVYADPTNWRMERRISGMGASDLYIQWLGPPAADGRRSAYAIPEGPQIAQRALGQPIRRPGGDD